MLDLFTESKEFSGLVKNVESGMEKNYVLGLSTSQKALYISGIFRQFKRQLIVVVENQKEMESLLSDLIPFVDRSFIFAFPEMELMAYEEVGMGEDIAQSRLRAISGLIDNAVGIFLIPCRAMLQRMVPPRFIVESFMKVKVGDVLDFNGFVKNPASMGYERFAKADLKGQMSVRGGIIDVFPYDFELPVRIEFFDDEVDSIRLYDPQNQRSTDNIDAVTISPAREFVYTREKAFNAIDIIEKDVEICKARKSEKFEQSRGEMLARVGRAVERLKEGIYFDNDYQYLPYIYDDFANITNYIGKSALYIVDEPIRLKEAFHGFEMNVREIYGTLLESDTILSKQADMFYSGEELFSYLEENGDVVFSVLGRGLLEGDLKRAMSVSVGQPNSYQGDFRELADDIKKYRKKGYKVVCVISSAERADRFTACMKDEGVDGFLYGDDMDGQRYLEVIVGELGSGLECKSNKFLLLTENEIYGRRKKRRRFAATEEGSILSSYLDLSPGDYVVHVNHGVGKYEGLKTMEVAGIHRDYLIIRYAGEDKVFVPTDQISMLQKYMGSGDTAPKLNKLGGSEWARAKAKVKESVQDMAQGLLELYAQREKIQGYAFSPDTVWQREFEDSFQYEETPDQLRAIREIKRDMETPRPMDRLLCGDVGFGKTEVAIRAAFKAAVDGKQVAVLVPTTILAQQHFATFSSRFEGFPMKVGIVSRFQSDSEIKKTVKGVSTGQIDVLVGTHRILSQDIKFKDLGLVIVDEEQRFGVTQKEKLKELRKEVDVLTLSATPIPRTLHMAMVSVRDMSLIETPPENRFPIRTYVVEYNDALIKEVISKEVDRGGQVYFVHNKVQDIDEVASGLRRLLPKASIGVAHGQMSEDHLEHVMMEFLNGEYDVLVCTTIIESGIDIPNVNTIIVNNADNLGLAQLYQLRGRVGRTNRVAYAYLTFKKDKLLSEVAEKRLVAIKEFTKLGSGYKIAMRDMEIRGAGNILGPEQHGHIAAVGFEMYCNLLEETMRELKGEPNKPEPIAVLIDLPLDAFIPDDYICDVRDKIEAYKKVNAVQNKNDEVDLLHELTDRFGDVPNEVTNLVSIAQMRNLAREVGVGSISNDKSGVTLKFAEGVRYSVDVLAAATKPFRGRCQLVGKDRISSIKIKTMNMPDQQLLDTVKGILGGIKLGQEVSLSS